MKATLWLVTLLLAAVLTLQAAPEGPAPAQKQMRLIVKGYDGNPKVTDRYDKFAFQVDTIDLRQPSEFLKLGDMIPNTTFKLVKFTFKEAFNEKLKENVDVSELEIVNTLTGKTATLILNKVVDVSK